MADQSRFASRNIVIAAAAICCCLAASGPAQTKKSVKRLHAVSPGASKVTDMQGKAWSNKTSQTTAADGTSRLEYEIKPWKKVVVIAKGDEVIGIDLYPPSSYTPKAMGEAFKLGRLNEVAELPAEARFATEGISGALLESQVACVLLEVEEAEGKQIVKRVRFFGEKPVVLESPQPPGSVQAPSRPTANYFGVVPGQTTREELLSLPKWGKPLKTIASDEVFDMFEYFGVTAEETLGLLPGELRRKLKSVKSQTRNSMEMRKLETVLAAQGLQGTEVLEYHISPWARVTAIVQGDIVWAVDLFPRPGMKVQDIENDLEVAKALERNKSLDTEPARSEESGEESSTSKIHSIAYVVPQGLRIWTKWIPHDVFYREYRERRVGIFYIPDPPDDPLSKEYYDAYGLEFWSKVLRMPLSETGEVKAIRLFADIPHRYPMLGIGMKDVVGDAIPKGLQREKAVLVGVVLPGSAGEEAGFEVGDVILSLNGFSIDDQARLQRRVLNCELDELTEFVVWRDGRELTLHAAPRIESLASAFRRRGDFYLKNQAFKAAIADMSTALKLEPDKVPTLVNRAVAWSEVGEYEKSLKDLNRAVEVDPQCAPSYANRAAFWVRRGDDAKALADFNEAIRLAPEYVFALRGRAALYRRLGENHKAVADEAGAKAIEEGAPQGK